ncbi:hypothetical protein RHGRI_010371 [Rhododendron griersonianum]|uniref:Gag-pol polyprotein n=1 Tax=Rhododendron griersonianum TaxID=479676 RepID=A0AAV6KIK8_9ERIC|nr:hypothetical protein RHGRI_010371 [Rhododendron griersonianum]
MTVPEYEARFVKLSKYALDLVNTEEKRCQRFRLRLSSKVATRLITYKQEEYARLVEMARRVGKDIQDYNDSWKSYKKSKTEGVVFGKSGGGTSKGGSQKSQVTRTQDFGNHKVVRQGSGRGRQNKDLVGRQAQAPVASSVGSVQGGRGGGAGSSTAPSRVFAITRQRAQASQGVVTDKPAKLLNIVLAIFTPVGEIVVVNVCYASCGLVIGGKRLLVDLLPLDMTDFEVILGMDFLSRYHFVMDCFSKEVIFLLLLLYNHIFLNFTSLLFDN